MIKLNKRAAFKPLLCMLGVLLLLSLAPESLYSQPIPARTEDARGTEEAAPTPSNAPRSTTSAQPKRPLRPVQRAPYRGDKVEKPTPEEDVFSQGQAQISELKRPSLITQAVLLSMLSLMPFIIMILTSFLKIVVVLSLLRTALGVQQAPPNQIINGVGFLLSLFIMYPTAIKMYDAAQTTINQQNVPESFLSPGSSTYVIEVAAAASQPMKDFLKRNSSARHQALFYRLVYRGLPEEYRETLKPDDAIVLVPSYITGQLKDAFEIGVLIYIPFFVIDLVTSNILLAMGMMMLSPVTISMPLKLFLLVMLDGWTILIEGLVKTFQ
ncbi:MAG: type III secretion system export apparatus subunit SctR [Parachlamydia sp.]|nr:type III secretion system export apparatus subunit SctR [Parachlamydia sp.]